MSSKLEGEHPYIGATRLAADVWEYMLSDDDGYRDVTNREDHVVKEISGMYPSVHPADIGYISLLGSQTADDRIVLKSFSV